MWPFSQIDGKTKRAVYATSCPLIPTVEEQGDGMTDIILYAILKGESIAYAILNHTLSGYNLKIEALRNYAKDHYALGSPKGMGSATTILDDGDVAIAIATDLNLPNGVVVDYNSVAPITELHLGMIFLETERGMIKGSTKINPANFPIHLFPEPAGWGMYKRIFIIKILDVDPLSAGNGVTIEYSIHSFLVTGSDCYTAYDAFKDYNSYSDPWDTKWDTVTETHYFSDHEMDVLHRDCCMAKYYELDSQGSITGSAKYWIYDIATGVYPELNPTEDLDQEYNLMPVVPIRYHDAQVGGTVYDTGKTLLNYAKIDLDVIRAEVEANDDIERAYITWGIDLQTTDNTSLVYLTEFFDYLADNASVDRWANISAHLNGLNGQIYKYSFNAVAQQQLVSDLDIHGLDVNITYVSIDSIIVNGSIGKVGTATKEMPSNPNIYFGGTVKTLAMDDSSSVIFRSQISGNTYKQVTVTGLKHVTRIRGKDYTTTLGDLLDPDRHSFVLPLHYGVLKTMPVYQQTYMYQKSLILSVGSYEEYKIEWYETAEFRMFITVASIVVIVYTGQTWVTGFLTAANVGMVAVLAYVFSTLGAAYLVDLTFKFVAEALGPEWAVVFAVIATIVLIYMGRYDYLMYVNSMITATTNELQRKTQMVIEDTAELKEEHDEKMQLLSDTEEITGLNDVIDIELLSAVTYKSAKKRLLNINEKPEEFYARTIHMGNIGPLITYNQISKFHDISLGLPKPDHIIT